MSEAEDRWLEILRKNRLEAEEICDKDEQLTMKKEIFEEAKENPEKSGIFLLHRDIEADGTCTWPPSYMATHGQLEKILSFGKESKEWP